MSSAFPEIVNRARSELERNPKLMSEEAITIKNAVDAVGEIIWQKKIRVKMFDGKNLKKKQLISEIFQLVNDYTSLENPENPNVKTGNEDQILNALKTIKIIAETKF
jgi:hypothetical protein